MPILEHTRDRLAAIYEQLPNAIVRSIPYYSKRCFEFDVVDANANYGYAWVKAVKGEVVFFDYNYGQRILRGGNETYKATRADTNIAKAKSTNGAADYAIERIGLKPVQAWVGYDADGVDTGAGTILGVADATVIKALKGLSPIYDPQSLYSPAVADSPFMQEASALFGAVSKETSIEVRFDGGNPKQLLPMHGIGQSDASPYARAHGTAEGDGAIVVEEGFHWAKDGEAGSDFELVATVQNDIVMPIALPRNVLSTTTTYTQGAPVKMWVEVLAVLEGLEFSVLSNNA